MCGTVVWAHGVRRHPYNDVLFPRPDVPFPNHAPHLSAQMDRGEFLSYWYKRGETDWAVGRQGSGSLALVTSWSLGEKCGGGCQHSWHKLCLAVSVNWHWLSFRPHGPGEEGGLSETLQVTVDDME